MRWSELLCDDRIRSYRTKSKNDLRTEFEKDYHRIIQSASFRRLQDKTQVFPLDQSDFIRTRLTHSLEVSSYGKSLGQNIARKIIEEIRDPEFAPSYAMDICDILQCAGLLHDIGNPPFGHFGETVIRDWFRKNLPGLMYESEQGMKPVTELLNEQMIQDFYHFEGNTQALRVVTKLHYLVDEHGMNLTKALLGTIIKYPVSSLEIDKNSGNIRTKKMGYYYADRETFEDIQESLGTHGSRHPLAYVLEAADDIAYLTADIEDAFKKGCISFTDLVRELKIAGENLPADDDYHALLQRLIDKYDKGVAKGEAQPEAYAVQNWIIQVQGRLISGATQGFTEHYREIMDGTYTKELIAGTPAQHIAETLGDIAYRYAFVSKPILKLEIAADQILNFLLDQFVPAVLYYRTPREEEALRAAGEKPACRQTAVQEKLTALISENYKIIYEKYSEGKSEGEKLYLRLLLVTDTICGMTDSYAKRLYQELNGLV